MADNYATIQFERFDSRASFLEVCECFNLDKIRLGFRSFDQTRQKGNRITASIDVFLSIRDANELAFQIQSNRIAKARAAAKAEGNADSQNLTLYKSKTGGNITEKGVRYREFVIFPGTKADYAIGGFSGQGKQDEKGLIQKVGKPDTKIFIPMSEEDLRALASALKRGIASYDFIMAMDYYKKRSAANNQREF